VPTAPRISSSVFSGRSVCTARHSGQRQRFTHTRMNQIVEVSRDIAMSPQARSAASEGIAAAVARGSVCPDSIRRHIDRQREYQVATPGV